MKGTQTMKGRTMKKRKLQAGLYMYGDYRINKEYMGETVGMMGVRRWNVSKLESGVWCNFYDAPSLKEAMILLTKVNKNKEVEQ
jgi:hypothetical protein